MVKHFNLLWYCASSLQTLGVTYDDLYILPSQSQLMIVKDGGFRFQSPNQIQGLNSQVFCNSFLSYCSIETKPNNCSLTNVYYDTYHGLDICQGYNGYHSSHVYDGHFEKNNYSPFVIPSHTIAKYEQYIGDSIKAMALAIQYKIALLIDLVIDLVTDGIARTQGCIDTMGKQYYSLMHFFQSAYFKAIVFGGNGYTAMTRTAGSVWSCITSGPSLSQIVSESMIRVYNFDLMRFLMEVAVEYGAMLQECLFVPLAQLLAGMIICGIVFVLNVFGSMKGGIACDYDYYSDCFNYVGSGNSGLSTRIDDISMILSLGFSCLSLLILCNVVTWFRYRDLIAKYEKH